MVVEELGLRTRMRRGEGGMVGVGKGRVVSELASE